MLTGIQCRNAKPKVGLYHEVKPYRQKHNPQMSLPFYEFHS